MKLLISSIGPLLFSLTVALAPSTPITKNLLFLVDCSGSMSGEKFARAIGATLEIAGQETDELNVAAIGFDQSRTRWRPPTGHDVLGPNWAKLPDPEVIVSLNAFLSGLCRNGDTAAVPALELAFAEPVEHLTIVFVTDGDFNEEQEYVIAKTREFRDRRDQAGHGPAVLVGYGISPPRNWDELKGLMESWPPEENGGYYVDDLGLPGKR